MNEFELPLLSFFSFLGEILKYILPYKRDDLHYCFTLYGTTDCLSIFSFYCLSIDDNDDDGDGDGDTTDNYYY